MVNRICTNENVSIEPTEWTTFYRYLGSVYVCSQLIDNGDIASIQFAGPEQQIPKDDIGQNPVLAQKWQYKITGEMGEEEPFMAVSSKQGMAVWLKGPQEMWLSLDENENIVETLPEE